MTGGSCTNETLMSVIKTDGSEPAVTSGRSRDSLPPQRLLRAPSSPPRNQDAPLADESGNRSPRNKRVAPSLSRPRRIPWHREKPFFRRRRLGERDRDAGFYYRLLWICGSSRGRLVRHNCCFVFVCFFILVFCFCFRIIRSESFREFFNSFRCFSDLIGFHCLVTKVPDG